MTKIAVFENEAEKLGWLATLLNCDVELTFEQVLFCQAELDQVGFYA